MGRSARPRSRRGARRRLGRVRLGRGCVPGLRGRRHGLVGGDDAGGRPRCDEAREGSEAMSYRIGIDVGGTFTDCVLRRPDGTRVLEKAPTTPHDQSDGVLAGLAQLAAAEGLDLAELLAQTRTIVHGTTTGDNALIQMKGAPTGLLVTEGFRDEIEFRR